MDQSKTSKIECGVNMKRYRVLIWFVEKWRAHPLVKYYEAETTKEVADKVKQEFPNNKEFLIVDVSDR